MAKTQNRRNRVVYVIGPFRASTMHGVIQNIRKAEKMAYDLWVMGFTAICPHMNTANMEGLIPDADILAGDIELMRRSDFVVCYLPFKDPRVVDSAGTQGEIQHAKVMKKPLYDDLHIVKLYEC